jgi:hypothetical protein
MQKLPSRNSKQDRTDENNEEERREENLIKTLLQNFSFIVLLRIQ